MNIRTIVAALAMLSFTNQVAICQVTIQSDTDVLEDGSVYLLLEAENYKELAAGDGGELDPDISWTVVDTESPLKTTPDIFEGNKDVLPADANPSGGKALFDRLGGPLYGGLGPVARYEVQFAFPGTYYLYTRFSMYNGFVDNNDNTYLNEDSIYLPPAFNMNTRSDWIGFEGKVGPGPDPDNNPELGDPETGNSDRDGWIPLPKTLLSAGEIIDERPRAGDGFFDGNLHWAHFSTTVANDENNEWVDDLGMAIEYEVTEDDLGIPLSFEISRREVYAVFDSFVFSTSPELLYTFTQEEMDGFFIRAAEEPMDGDFNLNGVLDLPDIDDLTAQSASNTNPVEYDLNADTFVNGEDVKVWIKDLANSWVGDANLDLVFSSSDLIVILGGGKYDTGEAAVWSTGDFTGDGLFNSRDVIGALADGGFGQGLRPAATAAVPEPSSLILLCTGLLLTLRRRK